MFEKLKKYLNRIGIEFTISETGKALEFTVESPAGSWNCLMSVHTPKGIGFYSTILHTVPKDRRTQMALYLTWLNNSRLFGNFEMDLTTGDVRFKTYQDCLGNDLTERAIDRMMLINVTTMQKYMPQIQAVMNGAHAMAS